ILWMKRHLDLPHDVCFITLKDYIFHKLVDQYVVDWSTASASGMFDVRNRSWAEQALDLLHIAPTQLSLPVSPRQTYSSMNREIARHIGLPADTPLIVGGGDGPLASLGVGAADKHILAVNVGSSAAARLITPAPWIDPDEKLYTQIADEDRWVVGGIVSCGGIVYEWFLDSFLVKASAQLTESNLNEIHNFSEREAAGIPAGADGVFFIPYLAGEQCPGWRSETRGSFWGLDFHHHHGHMARAVLEGITYSIYRIVERIQAMHPTPFSELRVSGGLTSSAVWLQMAADIFGYPIVIPSTKEGSAQGAAVLAWLALGMKSDYRDFSNRFDEMTRIQPRAEVHNYYRQQYEKFLELLNCSREIT
ncbi:MAG: FGGY-family carbohydrate kinase, partial [Anaerolineaceae bacterium]